MQGTTDKKIPRPGSFGHQFESGSKFARNAQVECMSIQGDLDILAMIVGAYLEAMSGIELVYYDYHSISQFVGAIPPPGSHGKAPVSQMLVAPRKTDGAIPRVIAPANKVLHCIPI